MRRYFGLRRLERYHRCGCIRMLLSYREVIVRPAAAMRSLPRATSGERNAESDNTTLFFFTHTSRTIGLPSPVTLSKNHSLNDTKHCTPCARRRCEALEALYVIIFCETSESGNQLCFPGPWNTPHPSRTPSMRSPSAG
jgi:hypothetical protein